MQFGEVLTQLRVDCPKTTGYDENIILLKEIEKVISGGCKTDLILDVVEVDEQWILDSSDEVNILICANIEEVTAMSFVEEAELEAGVIDLDLELESGVVDLCKFFNDPKINIGLMVAAPRHSDIFFKQQRHHSLPEWESYSPEQLKDFKQQYFMYVVFDIKVGFFCMNWTHNQLQQILKKVV